MDVRSKNPKVDSQDRQSRTDGKLDWDGEDIEPIMLLSHSRVSREGRGDIEGFVARGRYAENDRNRYEMDPKGKNRQWGLR